MARDQCERCTRQLTDLSLAQSGHCCILIICKLCQFKHSCDFKPFKCKRMHENIEMSSTSCLLSFEQTITPCECEHSSYFKAFKWKKTRNNSKYSHAIYSAHSTHTGSRVSDYTWTANWVSFHVYFFPLNGLKHTKLCQNTHLGDYPRKRFVMSWVNKQLRKKWDVKAYIGSILCVLKVTRTRPNLPFEKNHSLLLNQ